MKDGAQAQVVFQGAERVLYKHQLHGVAPQDIGIVIGKVGAEKIPAFAAADFAQVAAIQLVSQRANLRTSTVTSRAEATASP